MESWRVNFRPDEEADEEMRKPTAKLDEEFDEAMALSHDDV